MGKLNLKDFKVNEIKNLNHIEGAGTPTGAGSHDFGNGTIAVWDGDTQNDEGGMTWDNLQYYGGHGVILT